MKDSYTFEKTIYDWLAVYTSNVSPPAKHVKAFIKSTQLLDQSTLNIYLSGSFTYKIGDFTYTFTAGQSSLDLPDILVPAGKIIIEEPLEENSVRVCIHPLDKNALWEKQQIIAEAGITVEPLNGYVIRFTDGNLLISKSYTPTANEKVIIAKLI